MKKSFLIFTSILIQAFSYGQVEYNYLDFNNVGALLSNGGVFFNNVGTGTPGYELPIGSGNHPLYDMSFWFGGEDINGQLKIAGTTYTQQSDFFPGALTVSGTATSPASEVPSKQIYLVYQSQIDYHIANYDEVGYVMPADIANWPAHGEVAYDLDFYLAPFQDVDGNGIYEPAAGDYPIIRGDRAAYLIMNDKGGVHASGGDPIGIEIHCLFYQYASDDFLDNTTYLNMRVINRSTQTLYNFRSACFVDGDLGQSTDDYVGFNSAANVMYCYNGSNYDADYGLNPPAIGVTLLNADVSKFAAISTGVGVTGLPVSAADYYNYMNGKWLDGSPFTFGGNGYGGAVETDFVYDGLPTTDSWNELSEENVPGERRMMMSNQISGGVLRPNDEICYDYAIVYSADGDYLENVENVVNNAQDARSFYEGIDEPYCNAAFSGLDENEISQYVSIYPNPSNGTFTIDLKGNFDLQLYTIDGRNVFNQSNVNGKSPLHLDLSNGTYLMKITQNNIVYQSKIVIHN